MGKIVRYFAVIMLLLSLCLVAASLYLAISPLGSRDLIIAEQLNQQIDRRTNGKWSIDSISYNVVDYYPDIKIEMFDLQLYQDSVFRSIDTPLLTISKSTFRANMFSAVNGKFQIDELSFYDIDLFVDMYGVDRDAILNALKPIEGVAFNDNFIFLDRAKFSFEDVDMHLDSGSGKEELFEVNSCNGVAIRRGSAISIEDCIVKSDDLNLTLNLCYDSTKEVAELDVKSENGQIALSGEVALKDSAVIDIRSKVNSLIPISCFEARSKGDVVVEGVIDTRFDLETFKILSDNSNLSFKTNKLMLSSDKFMPVINKGAIYWRSGRISSSDIEMIMQGDTISLGLESESMLSFINKEKVFNIKMSVALDSKRIHPHYTARHLGSIVNIIGLSMPIEGVAGDFDVLLPSYRDIDNLLNGKELTSPLVITLNHLSASIEDAKVENLGGEVIFTNSNEVRLNNFEGYIDSSPVQFNAKIEYESERDSEIFKKILIGVDLTSDIINRFGGEEVNPVLSNVNTLFNVELFPLETNIELAKYMNIELVKFEADVLGERLCLKSNIVGMSDKLEFNNGDLDYGDLSISIFGDVSPNSNTVNIQSEKIDFDKIITAYNGDKSVKKSLDMLREIIDTEIRYNIKTLTVQEQKFNDFSGVVKFGGDEVIDIKDTRFVYAGGDVCVDMKVLNSDEDDKVILDKKITFDGVDLSQIDIDRVLSLGDISVVGSSANGKVTGSVESSLIIDTLFKIDKKSISAQVEFVIIDGELINLAPLRAASKYFRIGDLMHVKFDTLYNNYKIDKGKVTIPKMNISSTLGNYFIKGSADIEDINNVYLDLDVEIPWNTVAKAALHSIVAGRKDNTYRTQTIDRKIRKNYLKVNVKGRSDSLLVSLGD